MLLLHAGTVLLPILFAMGSRTLLVPRVHISQHISTEAMVGSTISYTNPALIISRHGSSPLKSTRQPWMQPQCLWAHCRLIGTPHIPDTLQPSHSMTAETHSSRLRRMTCSGCVSVGEVQSQTDWDPVWTGPNSAVLVPVWDFPKNTGPLGSRSGHSHIA